MQQPNRLWGTSAAGQMCLVWGQPGWRGLLLKIWGTREDKGTGSREQSQAGGREEPGRRQVEVRAGVGPASRKQQQGLGAACTVSAGSLLPGRRAQRWAHPPAPGSSGLGPTSCRAALGKRGPGSCKAQGGSTGVNPCLTCTPLPRSPAAVRELWPLPKDQRRY